jgi:hypothetical protein
MKLRVPRPLTLVLFTTFVIVAGVGLRFSIPAYQQWSAVSELQRYGHVNTVRPVGAEWVRRFVGERMIAFDPSCACSTK